MIACGIVTIDSCFLKWFTFSIALEVHEITYLNLHKQLNDEK